jgi:hypothetical protein
MVELIKIFVGELNFPDRREQEGSVANILGMR